MIEQSEQIDLLITALVQAKKAMNMPSKSATAQMGNFSYTYANLSDYIKAIEPQLIEYGLVFMQHISDNEKGMRLNSLLCHISGQWMKSSFPIDPEENSSSRLSSLQEQGKAITYLKRYAASAIFFRAGDDDDNDGATSQKKQKSSEKRYTFTWISKEQVKTIRDVIAQMGIEGVEDVICNRYKLEALYKLPVEKYEEVLSTLQKSMP
jgi:hypothetical protein